MFRLKNSDGSLKNLHLWNIATDAIINENLEQDGFFADGVTPNDKFINITKEKDIDNISITRLGSGTNFDVAVREFSNNQSINKIIFTDGWPGKMPAEDTKRINVIWLVYENKNFAPCCGKVINVQPKKIIDTQTKAVTQQNININENTR